MSATQGDVFRQRLAERRAELGLSQTQLALRLRGNGRPWHQTSIAKLEAGDRAVKLDEAFEIAADLDVSFAWMVGEAAARDSLATVPRDAIAAAMELQGAAQRLVARLHAALQLDEASPARVASNDGDAVDVGERASGFLDAQLGAGIRLRRESLGLSQRDFAKRVYSSGWLLNATALPAIEAGRRSLRMYQLEIAARVLEVRVVDLLLWAER